MSWFQLTPPGRRKLASLIEATGRVLVVAGAVAATVAVALACWQGWVIGSGSSGVPEWTEIFWVPLSIAALVVGIGFVPAVVFIVGVGLRQRAAELREPHHR